MKETFAVLCLLVASCKKHDATPAADPIPTDGLPSGVPKARVDAINAAFKANDAALPTITDSDCPKAAAAIRTIVDNIKIVIHEGDELHKAVVAANDPSVAEWAKRHADPVIRERTFETGKQLASKGPGSKCIADEGFKAALQSVGTAMAAGSTGSAPGSGGSGTE